MNAVSLAALILASLFTGAALYITLVEHPARLVLDDVAQLAQWQPSYRRALPIQAGLAIAGGMAGLAVSYMWADWTWLAGSLALLANWPFTLLVIMPVNKRLQALQPIEAGPASRQLLLRWGRLHDVRSALGVVATMVFAWGIVDAI
jgi:hypothetical protein